MSKIAIVLRKHLLGLIVVVAASASLPLSNAHALAASIPPTPPAPGTMANARLERVWARQQTIHERLTRLFDAVDDRIAGAQTRIDNAKAKGKDVAALQAALDAFSGAVKQARPIFESTKGIIASHQGFDASGNVTNTADAERTVIQLGEKYREIRGILRGPFQALREAIRDLRQVGSASPLPPANP